MAVIEAGREARSGVMNDFESGLEDSFQDGLLDCPWYTRPAEFEGLRVPEALMSGDHARIGKWREREALARTRARRPDILHDEKNC